MLDRWLLFVQKTTVSIQPAEYPSWSDARSDMMVEAKRAHKAKLLSEMSAAADEAESSAIRARYEKEEKAIEHDIDHAPLNVNLALDLSYNFLSR